ncbi:ATP synthase F1 subunit gamma [Suipraeoptans intestinalis]|uniref:ATP synthase gamma chain n=1 Tax=Suipraeoptans intestinalis TaxID=2606628 RepID=A0A6N7V1N1_9FIRM|nr:ATP synthase F1 subunit gamma [Suipraeoptans intestinalis]MDD7770525.1 ATP synthase F1 subunit gamma [Suipraeoptans intestinalis]MDY3121260.1 ATP synthase F1 subunit gamma [Suipraeoptans intestinalis]MSR93766.1 ATP synthase F1 subunit gamma [Suipraeoptans intestinalis]
MANTREMKERIDSIQETKKITNAMYLISSSKVKQARKKLSETEPFFYAMQAEIARILKHVPDMHSHFFDRREKTLPEKRKIGCIVITADKGLAGAYNHNVIKLAEEMKGNAGQYRLYVLGELGRQYFSGKEGVVLEESFRYTVQNPNMNRARRIASKVVELFEKGEVDDVYIIYTRMVNAMEEAAEKIKLLPLQKTSFQQEMVHTPEGDYLEGMTFYPSAHSVMDSIVPNYLNGIIYGCLVESYCSEHNARMKAMQNATDSATKMLGELRMTYNRARQADITQELTEVVGGAGVQKRK